MKLHVELDLSFKWKHILKDSETWSLKDFLLLQKSSIYLVPQTRIKAANK